VVRLSGTLAGAERARRRASAAARSGGIALLLDKLETSGRRITAPASMPDCGLRGLGGAISVFIGPHEGEYPRCHAGIRRIGGAMDAGQVVVVDLPEVPHAVLGDRSEVVFAMGSLSPLKSLNVRTALSN
jgi:hypothetical protein